MTCCYRLSLKKLWSACSFLGRFAQMKNRLALGDGSLGAPAIAHISFMCYSAGQ